MARGNRLQVALQVILSSSVLLGALVGATEQQQGCDVAQARESAKNPMMTGGWRANNSSAGGIVAERAVALLKSGENALAISKHQRVIEGFSQVVNGMNYCVYFRASGRCDAYHCKSFECTAKAHQPLATREDDIQVRGVQCNEQLACDIQNVARMAKTPMPGGWHNSTNDENILKLHRTASSIANIKPGDVVEAYTQVVAGFNYCIRFRSYGISNCGKNCQPVICTASGHAPLSHQTTNADELIRVGVNCHVDGPLLMAMNSADSGRSMVQLVAASAIVVLANFW